MNTCKSLLRDLWPILMFIFIFFAVKIGFVDTNKPMFKDCTFVEPNEPNAVLVWDDNDPNDREIKYDIDYGMYAGSCAVVIAEPKEYRCPVHGGLTTWETMTISTGDDKELGTFCAKCMYEHLAKYLKENLPGIEKIEPNEVE
jgi:hypothetical protein